MRLVVFAFAALLARPTSSDACSISGTPAAHILEPPSGAAPGRQPLIVLWMTKTKPIAVTQVPASCKPDTICKGTPVAVDRTGWYLRPKAPLADGTRIQVVMDGSKLLADKTVTTGLAPALPEFDVKLVSAKQEKEGLCSPAGPVVRLTVKPRQPSQHPAWLLVYLEKPDPKQPMAKLAFVSSINGKEIELGNGLGLDPWLKAVPKQLWVIVTDGEGHLGPVVQLP
jgi:hypothetical protein